MLRSTRPIVVLASLCCLAGLAVLAACGSASTESAPVSVAGTWRISWSLSAGSVSCSMATGSGVTLTFTQNGSQLTGQVQTGGSEQCTGTTGGAVTGTWSGTVSGTSV